MFFCILLKLMESGAVDCQEKASKIHSTTVYVYGIPGKLCFGVVRCVFARDSVIPPPQKYPAYELHDALCLGQAS